MERRIDSRCFSWLLAGWLWIFLVGTRKSSGEEKLEEAQTQAAIMARTRAKDTLIRQMKKKEYTIDELVRMTPALESDQEFWRAFVASKDWLPFDALPVSLEEIWAQDAELALELCAHDYTLYDNLPMDHPLKRNEQLVEAYLKAFPDALWQRAKFSCESDASVSPLGCWCFGTPSSVGAVCPRSRAPIIFQTELWQQREIVLAWAQGGGNFHEAIPDAFKHDGELMKLFLRRRNTRIDPEELPRLPDHLLADKQFMMGIVVENLCLLFDVGANLVGDTDLVIAALSGPAGLSVFCYGQEIGHPWHDWWEANSFPRVAETVREKLQSHDVFLKLILGGDVPAIRSSLENDPALSLYKILSGVNEETALVFKKLLAEYIGVPTTKKELEMLRGARRTLALTGFHWPDHVKCSFLEGEERMQVD